MDILTHAHGKAFIKELLLNTRYAAENEGRLYRLPFNDEHLGPVSFYEPVHDAGPMIPGQTDFISDNVQPLRVINCDVQKATHMFAYFQIELETLFTTGGGIKRFHNDAPRQFRRLSDNYVMRTALPTWSTTSDHLMLQVVMAQIEKFSGADLASLYCWLENPTHYSWKMMTLDGEATFFLTYSTAETLHSTVILTKSHVSEMTYLLAKRAWQQDYKYLDLWNVSITPRERYKRAFFTASTEKPCFFNGDDTQYDWLRRI